MNTFSLSVKDAKAEVMKRVLELEEEYCQLRDEFLEKSPDLDPSSPIIRLFEMSEALQAGSMLWSTTCYRYYFDDETPYVDYLESRCKEGIKFFDDCGESEEILPNNGL
ncbi:hypothetical protein PT974_03004 [Cladobotryum mycophilum]|uniref:Phage protein n=1 Tax=Cladobotryum mycophilum TaxID=491253 RepID=A0ABR0T0V7_9HYPO